MSFIIGQIISIVALIISVVIAQFKDVKYVLLGEIAANLAVALSFVFLGGMSGAWICIVATAQTIIIFWANKYELAAEKRKILMVVFAVIYMAGTAVIYKGWSDVVSCTCALLYVAAIVQTETKKYRWFMVANSLLWIIYDFNTAAYVNIITHGMLLISLLIAMVRLDRKMT